MARPRFTKWQRKENQRKELARKMAGDGLYLFENPSDADLTLPRPTKAGVRRVGPKGRFQGDSYYLGLVRSHELRLVEILQTPEAERQAMEKKLILDQPDTVTEAGRVERVLPAPKPAALSEGGQGEEQPKPDVLLTEDPMSGVEIILE
jgi:hypothetical protein